MNNFDVDKSLNSMVLLVDTREQDTLAMRKRIKETGLPYERQKLDFGDYSCKCTLPNGEVLSLQDKLAIERKMNVDELCMCFGKGRKRFEREFLRAKNNDAKMYLLIEKGNWKKIFNHEYRSLYKPDSLIASVLAWSIRYGYQLIFCDSEVTGKLIYKIFRYELKELLESGVYG